MDNIFTQQKLDKPAQDECFESNVKYSEKCSVSVKVDKSSPETITVTSFSVFEIPQNAIKIIDGKISEMNSLTDAGYYVAVCGESVAGVLIKFIQKIICDKAQEKKAITKAVGNGIIHIHAVEGFLNQLTV